MNNERIGKFKGRLKQPAKFLVMHTDTGLGIDTQKSKEIIDMR